MEARTGADANTPQRLRQRQACNQTGSADFGRFVLDLLAPTAEDTALDIGAGTGAQMIPLAGRVRRIVGLDRSPEMAAAVTARISGPSVRMLVGDMDALARLDLARDFSLIYAVYALHYASNPSGVIAAAAELLSGPDARLVVVTPDIGNNAAWFADLAQLYALPAEVLDVPSLGREVFLPAFRATFRTVTSAVLESEVAFSSLDPLIQYYDACPHYCRPDQRHDARRYFQDKLAWDGDYRITKRSLGIVGRP